MAILNYTTTIDAFKTIGEIHSIIVKRGAKTIMTEYDDQGAAVGLTFLIDIKGSSINFRLPANYQGVLRSMATSKNIGKTKINKDQAIRVCWRIIKDWIEAQMALIDADIALMEQVFLPYAVAKDGQTFFDHFQNNSLLLN